MNTSDTSKTGRPIGRSSTSQTQLSLNGFQSSAQVGNRLVQVHAVWLVWQLRADVGTLALSGDDEPFALQQNECALDGAYRHAVLGGYVLVRGQLFAGPVGPATDGSAKRFRYLLVGRAGVVRVKFVHVDYVTPDQPSSLVLARLTRLMKWSNVARVAGIAELPQTAGHPRRCSQHQPGAHIETLER
jgi:hypothetical protein